MREIYTSKGESIYVDDEDYEELNKCKWRLDNGYARGLIKCNGNFKQVRMHRVIMKAEDGQFIDHINQNRADNRKENLRFCNMSGNKINAKIQENNTSGIVGVYWIQKTNKWRSSICINRKNIYLGVFSDLNEAIKVRAEAEIKYFGEFRNTLSNSNTRILEANKKVKCGTSTVYNNKIRSTNTSGERGVCWSKDAKKWLSSIRINGKKKYLGCYDKLVDAAAAYNKALELKLTMLKVNNFDK